AIAMHVSRDRPMNVRTTSSTVIGSPWSPSCSANTRFEIGSESTSTPSQSKMIRDRPRFTPSLIGSQDTNRLRLRFLHRLRRRFLEHEEVAAARGRAATLRGRQHRHAEVELGVVLHVREVAGRGPHDRRLLLEEVPGRGAPLDYTWRHHLVLAAEVHPELQRL